MSKFKVGDKVRVVRKFEDTGDGLYFNKDMISTIGAIGTVVNWENMPANRTRVSFSEHEEWTYTDDVLKLVLDSIEDSNPESKISLSKVGDMVSVEVVGKLTRVQVIGIMDVIYGS